MGTIWAYVSGKGGVGKSTLALCTAVLLARRGKKVALVDADAGVRNLDMMLGVENKIVFDLLDVMEQSASLAQATLAIKDVPGLSLLCASQTQEQDALAQDEFERILKKLKKTYDYILIDCPTGIGRIVHGVLSACDEAVLITMADDIAMRDADHIAGILSRVGSVHPHVIVNRVRPQLQAAGETYYAKAVAQTLDAYVLGEVPEDEEIYRCMLRRVPPIEGHGAGAQAIKDCVCVMLGEKPFEPLVCAPKPRGFWSRVFHAKGIEGKA